MTRFDTVYEVGEEQFDGLHADKSVAGMVWGMVWALKDALTIY